MFLRFDYPGRCSFSVRIFFEARWERAGGRERGREGGELATDGLWIRTSARLRRATAGLREAVRSLDFLEEIADTLAGIEAAEAGSWATGELGWTAR